MEALEALKPFYGTYLGFSPSSSSPVAMGELEVNLSECGVGLRMATGVELQTSEKPFSFVSVMDREEVAERFIPGSEYADRIKGFRINHFMCLFLEDANWKEYGLVMGGLPGDALGPTLLHSPSQLERGHYKWKMRAASVYPGASKYPRLKHGGKFPRPSVFERFSPVIWGIGALGNWQARRHNRRYS